MPKADASTVDGRQLRADARRNVDAILEAGMAALAEDPHASMQEIAEVAGLHRATVYRHFPARNDLVAAIQRRALDEAQAALRESRPEEGPGLDALERVVRALVTVAARYAVLLRQDRDPDQLRREKEAVRSRVRAVVARATREGALRADLPDGWIAGALFGLLAVALKEIFEGRLESAPAPDLVLSTFLRGAGAAAQPERDPGG
jgi:AcrR family transcriptional regulator